MLPAVRQFLYTFVVWLVLLAIVTVSCPLDPLWFTFLFSPLITLACWGTYIKHYLDDRHYLAMKGATFPIAYEVNLEDEEVIS